MIFSLTEHRYCSILSAVKTVYNIENHSLEVLNLQSSSLKFVNLYNHTKEMIALGALAYFTGCPNKEICVIFFVDR